MTCFVLPKWVINKIDLIRRRFLWGKVDGQGRGISLINWNTVCLPKQRGGLGAPNLEIRNISLLLRWWWKAQAEPHSLWTSMILKLRRIGTQTDGPKIWAVRGSFFWQGMIKLRHLFHWCTSWTIGNGTTVSFWYDPWCEAPLRFLRDGLPRPIMQRISLREAIPLFADLMPAAFHNQDFTDMDDELIWRWTSSGLYTANSVYRVMLSGGKIKWRFQEIWDSYTPSKVRIFTFLMMNAKILTADVMIRRHMTTEGRCVMCNSGVLETAEHLFFACPYAEQVWGSVQAKCGFKLLEKGDSVVNTWDRSRPAGAANAKLWASRFMCVLWMLWKQRNDKVFRDKQTLVGLLVDKTLEETNLWIQFCRPAGARKRTGIG